MPSLILASQVLRDARSACGLPNIDAHISRFRSEHRLAEVTMGSKIHHDQLSVREAAQNKINLLVVEQNQARSVALFKM